MSEFGDIKLVGFRESAKHRVLTEELADNIRGLIPPRLQATSEWHLEYSLEQDGASLMTLYDRVKPSTKKHHGYVLVVRDSLGGVFGAYTNEYFHPKDHQRYYGNADCFLWKQTEANGHQRFEAYPYTGVNDFVIFCTAKFLSLGGGDGHYGLWLDDDLDNGVTYRSLTFGNDPLSKEGNKFQVLAVEVWRI